MPFSPMKTHDRPPHAGVQPGGLLSPWCHTSFSAGCAQTAANWYVARIVAGASSSCATGTLGDIDSTDRGASTFPACPEPVEGACPEPARGELAEPVEGACPELVEGSGPSSALRTGRQRSSTVYGA